MSARRRCVRDPVRGSDASRARPSSLGIPAEQVARTILRAITAERPKPFYAVGGNAPMVFALRRTLPQTVMEAANHPKIRAALKLGTKPSKVLPRRLICDELSKGSHPDPGHATVPR